MSEKKSPEKELPIIQQTYDLIKWYVPVLNNLPRDHHFILGDRIIRLLYETLEQLIAARYSREKLPLLEKANLNLELMRYQTRLLRDFRLMDYRRYGHVSGMINNIGRSLGGWVYQQRGLAS